MHDLTAFQRDLLFVSKALARGKGDSDGANFPNGLEIKDEVGEYYEEQINHGRLYPNLDTLVDMGLIEKFPIDKRTNGYKVTERGNRELQSRIEWQSRMLNGGK